MKTAIGAVSIIDYITKALVVVIGGKPLAFDTVAGSSKAAEISSNQRDALLWSQLKRQDAACKRFWNIASTANHRNQDNPIRIILVAGDIRVKTLPG